MQVGEAVAVQRYGQFFTAPPTGQSVSLSFCPTLPMLHFQKEQHLCARSARTRQWVEQKDWPALSKRRPKVRRLHQRTKTQGPKVSRSLCYSLLVVGLARLWEFSSSLLLGWCWVDWDQAEDGSRENKCSRETQIIVLIHNTRLI